MRAVGYDAVGAVPTVREVPEPDCPDDGAVITVAATGVCRSDWHAWQGHDPVALPHVPGHELAGTVAEVGPAVDPAWVGVRVTVPFVCGCGRCATCASGNPQVCPDQTQPGFTGPGSFADLVAVHAAEANLVRLPHAVSFLTAAALGCRLATAFRALTVHGRVGPGDQVAVFGCGGVGLSAVMVARALGAEVTAVDVSASALALAGSLGAAHLVDSTLGDPAEQVLAATRGGAHVAMDALGSPATATASVRSLRRRGRHLQVGLLLGPEATGAIPMDLVVSRELEVYGSHGIAPHEYPALLALIADGRLQPERLIGSVIGLDEAPEALMALSRPAQQPGITVVDLAR